MTAPTVLPVAGAVAPAAGVGVTFHGDDWMQPATIVRAGRHVFWFRLDGDDGSPAAGRWTYRAILRPDGTWREDHDMRRVDVGVRRRRPPPGCGVPGRRMPDQLAAAVERIEPWLLKRRWYPMTYMMIPSVLRAADELLTELAAYAGPERERVQALHARLSSLRQGFRNLGGGDASAATGDAEWREAGDVPAGEPRPAHGPVPR